VPDGGFELAHQIDIDRRPEDVFAFLTDEAGIRAVDPALVDYASARPRSS
jgi:hypothetical protein